MNAHPVIGVVSGRGGAGGSSFAVALADCAGLPALLVDCDPLGGGIDVLLGCERLPGPRWGQVRLRGGALDPQALFTGLPRWREVRFLAADTRQPLSETAVDSVLEAGSTVAPMMLDLPRTSSPARSAALRRCDLVVLVAPAEVRGLTATAMVAPGLDERRTGLVLRGPSRALPSRRIEELLGLPVLAELPHEPAVRNWSGSPPRRYRRSTRTAVQAVLAASLQRHGARVAAA